MPNRILPNPLTAAEVEQFRLAHPAFNIAEIDAGLAALPAPNRFSQTRAAQEALDLARRMQEAYPHLSGTNIGSVLRANHQSSQKLTKLFDREIGRLLNEQPAKPDKRRRKPSPGTDDSVFAAERSATGAVLRAGPSIEETADLLPDVAPVASPPQAQPHNHQHRSDQPATTDDRPYCYNGTFSGNVYKTGFPCIGEFYDAIKTNADMTVVRACARTIISINGAEAAMAMFHPDDHAIFNAVARDVAEAS